MKKILAILVAASVLLSFAACKGKTETPADETADAQQTEAAELTEETAEKETEETPAETTEALTVEGDPVEYEQSYWEEKYPDYMFCPFSIEENGEEKSYYWPMGYEGLDGTIGTWIECPFNWNGWHKTEDGCIVNADETLKITDDWANGDESMSSFCTVTTETYVKPEA